jgi:hypothetical protein
VFSAISGLLFLHLIDNYFQFVEALFPESAITSVSLNTSLSWRSIDSLRPTRVETGLSVLAGLVLALMLVPLAVIAWKSCSDFLSDKVSHSIFYHPLEDWTQY